MLPKKESIHDPPFYMTYWWGK